MKTTANIATMPGREDSLRTVILSLEPQVSEVRIYFNDFEPYSWLKDHPKVHAVQGPDLQAMGKLYFIPTKTSELYLTCDDDLLYPPDYVDTIKRALSKRPKSIVSFHGRRILARNNHYYRDNKCYHHKRDEPESVQLHTVGTGVSAFLTEHVRPSLTLTERGRMVDVSLGLWAARNNVQCHLIPHKANYIDNHHVAQKDGVWLSQRLTDCAIQNEMANEIWDRVEGNPKVSIIIPYNKDRGWLSEAISSVENQQYPGEIELILAEGNYSKSVNLNRGVKDATGLFVKYLDEDDRVLPNCVADSVETLRKGFDFIHGDAVVKSEGTGNIKYHVAPIKIPTAKGLSKRNTIHGGTTMYTREMWDALGGFDESLKTCEEFDFHLRALASGYRIGYTGTTLAMYRRHGYNKSLGAGSDQKWRAKVREGIRKKGVALMRENTGRVSGKAPNR